MEYIYDKYGYHILDATLRLTLATWESETNSLSANFLKAIARIIAVFGDALREDIFKEHVGRCSVKSIIRTAKERRPGVLGYAEAMLIAYNAKNKYRLPIKSSMAVNATKSLTTKKQTMTLLPFETEVYPVFPDIPHLLLYYSRGPVSSAARQTGICTFVSWFY